MPLSSKQTSDYLVEPALVGAGLAAGSAYWWGSDMTVIIAGGRYPMWPIMAAAGFAASAAMNAINNTVNDHLPEQVSIITHPLETAISVAGTTGLMMAAEQLVSPGLVGDGGVPLVAIGAAAQLGARYVAHEYIMPWIDSFKA